MYIDSYINKLIFIHTHKHGYICIFIWPSNNRWQRRLRNDDGSVPIIVANGMSIQGMKCNDRVLLEFCGSLWLRCADLLQFIFLVHALFGSYSILDTVNIEMVLQYENKWKGRRWSKKRCFNFAVLDFFN